MNLNFSEIYDKKRLLSVASEKQIYEFLLKEPLVDGEFYYSIVRPPGVVDNNPSLSFMVANNKIYWRDWGYGLQGDVIDFLKHYYRENMTNAIKRFISEYKMPKTETESTILVQRERRKIRYETTPFTAYDLNYWIQYGVTINTLDRMNVANVKTVFDDKTGKVLYTASEYNPAYVYEKLGFSEKSFQIYRPLLDDYRKFRNQFVDHTNVLFNGNLFLKQKRSSSCVITKSGKDTLVFLGHDIDAIGVTTESGINIDELTIRELKAMYKNVYTWFDNDLQGVTASAKYKNKFSTLSLLVPLEYTNCKDPSDLRKYHKDVFINIINGLR